MADSDMKKVDMTKAFGNLNESDKHFVKKLEKMNLDRAQGLKKLRKRNFLTGGIIGVGVIGIYLYSMYAVRQEKFLEGFDKMPDEKKVT